MNYESDGDGEESAYWLQIYHKQAPSLSRGGLILYPRPCNQIVMGEQSPTRCLTNRAGHRTTREKGGDKMNLAMIDTLIFTVDLVDFDVLIPIIEELSILKERAKMNVAEAKSEKVLYELNGMTFEVLSNGKAGYGFLLHNQEFEIDIAQYKAKNDYFYPIKVRIKSETLWAYGPTAAYSMIMQWISTGIGCVTATKVSRADLCCHTDELDLHLHSVADFKGTFRQSNTRYYNREISSIEFGCRSSLIFCRIYDKTLEVIEKGSKQWFFDIWKDRNMNISKIWNVEFELKRDFFSEFGVESVEDLFETQASIWEYCTDDYLTKTMGNCNRIDNCKVDPVWISIRHSFDQFESRPLIKRQKQRLASFDALIPQVTGLITTLAAKMETESIDVIMPEIVLAGKEHLRRKHKKTYQEVIKEKKSLQGYPED